MSHAAVIFDLGGVVLDSPLHFIAEFERENGLPEHFIAGVVGAYAGQSDGPWHRLERGELRFEAFCADFDRAVAARGQRLSTARMMREMSRHAVVRPAMVAAIRRLRGHGLKVAALTNNWVTDDAQYRRMQGLRSEFDQFVESCKVGMRKPDPGDDDGQAEREGPRAMRASRRSSR